MQNLPKKVRSKKLNSRVDLTAMVSVSFLLIIFFMVVGELSKAKVMELSLPAKYSDEEWCHITRCGMGIPDRLITILLDDNDQVITYSGLFYPDQNPKVLNYGKNGIRKELSIKTAIIREELAQTGRSNRGVIAIIKPSKKSNFKNLVDILDEMAIANIETYTIVNEFTPEEEKLLASK